MKTEIDLEEFKEYLITLFMKKEIYTKEEIYDKINEVFTYILV